MHKLTKEIKQIIEDVICCKYTGKLKVEKEDLDSVSFYEAFIFLDRNFAPLVIGCEGTEEEFKAFIKKELKSRKLQGVDFYKICQKNDNYDGN